ncbi:MAG: hypothetical protein FJZ58_03480 [Chlamydiae bacterium]|nr:hypothetical protein [Chlamydiota bacterium]
MKNVSLCCVMLAGLGSLYADMQTPPDVNTPPSHAFIKLPKGIITPMVLSSGVKVVTSADFIWWKTTIDNLEYAVAGVHNGSLSVGTTKSVSQGNFTAAGSSFEPGFKVALGLIMNHDGWDVNAEYTWLNPATQTNSVVLHSREGLISSFGLATRSGSLGLLDLQDASSSFTHHFNVLDTDLGRNFFISKYISLRPQIGLKFAWTEEKSTLDYDALGSLSPVFFDFQQKQNLFGMGVRAGVGSLWHFCKNWGIYGDLFFSGLWGWLSTNEKQVQGEITTCNNKTNLQKMIPVVEYGLGLNYTTWFYEDTCQFSMQAGWEQQVWMDYNNLLDISYVVGGNMNIQGLTVKMGFAF